MDSTGTSPLDQTQLDILGRAAQQAPSLHNSQPWFFKALPTGIEVHEDITRSLPQTDPTGRERLISCGAAVRNCEVAMAYLGRRPVTQLCPSAVDPGHLATVTAGRPEATSHDERLYAAIWLRRTHRRVFLPTGSAHDGAAALRSQPGADAWFVTVSERQRARFARLLWTAAQRHAHDPLLREELEQWTRQDLEAVDGVPFRSHGTAPFPVDALLHQGLRPVADLPPRWIEEDLAQNTVAVLFTRSNGRLDAVRAGQLLEGALLELTVDGLVAAFLNIPVQHEDSRAELTGLLGQVGYPQVVLRVGKALVEAPETPRRSSSEVLRPATP